MTHPAGDDRGAATVLAAVLVAAIAAVTTGGIWLGAAVLARHRAQAAADLAALAAAAGLPAGVQAACEQARGLTAAMAARMRGCDVAGLDVTVTVSVDTGLSLGGEAWAASRAGPAGPR